MRRGVGRAAAALLLLALQTSLGGPAGVLGVRLDFLLLFVVAAGMRDGPGPGMGWGLALGWAQDALSIGMPGLNLFTKALLGLAAGSLRDQLDCQNPNAQGVVAAAATVLEGLVQLALLRVFSAAPDVVAPLLGTVLPAAAAHGVLLPAAGAGRRAALGAFARRRAPAAAAG